jgi:FHS family L-fucose permease-like MFS transporter
MQPPKLVEKRFLVPFILITSLFALWGFANDITHPMVAAFQTLMEFSVAKSSLIQLAFYGGYATMAVPAALFIRKYSYKSGILLGLALYAVGAFMFIPAAQYQSFAFFCVSLYVLTFGLAFLETTANPLILSLGAPETATRRLNMAQAFNPIGALSGMSVAALVVLPNLISDRRDAAGNIIYHTLSEAEKADIRLHDLATIRNPYVLLGVLVVIVFVIIACTKIPQTRGEGVKTKKRITLSRLWGNKLYRNGVVTQMFYVGAQIMTWTFIIQYADRLGFDKATAQKFNIVGMTLFLTSRFISTYLMQYISSRKLLMLFGLGACLTTLGTILIQIVCQTAGLHPDQVVWDQPDTALAPNSGNTTASRQTLFTGEAARRAATELKWALEGRDLSAVEGVDFRQEYTGITDKMNSDRENPISHIAYGYATHVVILDEKPSLLARFTVSQ